MTDTTQQIPRRTAAMYGWAVVWLINAVLLGAGFAVKMGWTGNRYVRKLAPNWEYTLGNWWSAVLLLTFSLLCAEAAFKASPRSRARLALSLLSLLGLGLSLDELGSLHERAADWVPGSKTLSLAPFAATGLLAVGWSLWALWRDGGKRRAVCGWALAGFACLLSVEPLDHFVQGLENSRVTQAFGVVWEEGTEMLGAVLLIVAGLAFKRTAGENGLDPYGNTNRAVLWLGLWVLVIAAPLLVIREVLASADKLDLHTRGDMGAAPAVVLLVLIAWWFLRTLPVSHGRQRLIHLALAGVALLVSIELGCHLYAWISRESVTSPLGVWWVQALLTLGAFAGLVLATRFRPARGSSRAGVA